MAPLLDNALIKRLASIPTSANQNKSPKGASGWIGEDGVSTTASSPTGERPPQSARAGRRLDLEGTPQTPNSARSRPRTPQMEISEKPLEPAKRLRMQAVARHRSSELQNLFTSRHLERQDHLQGRLSSLNKQETDIRARIAGLEMEMQEATEERIKDMNRVPSDERIREAKVSRATMHQQQNSSGKKGDKSPGGPPDLDGQEEADAPTDEDGLVVQRDTSSFQQRGSVSIEEDELQELPEPCGFDPSKPRGSQIGGVTLTEAVTETGTADKRYQDEVLLPLLVRRRAEARFKEASLVHDNSMNMMKSELAEIDRRTSKQTAWLKHVDNQVLQVELTKARYTVRLESARKRTESLGQDLGKAYENMTALLEERIGVEDFAAKNDAMLWYLHLLGVSDTDNAANFIDNKKDLLFLTKNTARLRRKRTQLDTLLDQVRCTQLLATDIVKHSEELASLADLLQQLWNLVPVEWKDSVFKSVQKGLAGPLSMHPVNAIQALQGASSHVNGAMKSYLRAVSEYVDGAHAQTSRRRGFIKGGDSAKKGTQADLTGHLSDTASQAFSSSSRGEKKNENAMSIVEEEEGSVAFGRQSSP